MRTVRSHMGPPFWLAVALTVVALVPAPGAGQAALVLINTAPDTTAGWSFPTDFVQRHTLADDPDDAYTGPLGVGVPVGTPLYPAVEIVAFHFDESDPEVFKVRLEVEDLDPQAMMRQHGFFGVFVEVSFLLGDYRYAIRGYMSQACEASDGSACDTLGGATVVFDAVLEVREPDDRCCGDEIATLPTRALVDEDAVEALIPRHLLVGYGDDLPPRAGEAVRGIQVETSTTTAIYDSTYDRAPEEFEPQATNFLLRQNSYGSEVRLSARAAAGDEPIEFSFNAPPVEPRRATYDVGETMPLRIPMYVENLLRRKVIIVPSAEVLSGGDGLSVKLPKAIELPAFETRKFEIVVNGTSAPGPADPLELRVTARPLAISGAVGDRLVAVARGVPQFSPEHPRMYLHVEQRAEPTDIAGEPVGGGVRGYMNTLPQDPIASVEEAYFANGCTCATPRFWDHYGALSSGFSMNPQTPGVMHLELDAPSDGELSVTPYVFYDGEIIASGQYRGPITAGENTLEIPLNLPEGADQLRAGGQFFLEMPVRFQSLPVDFFGISAGSTVPKLQVQGQSWFELPVTKADTRLAEAEHLLVDIAAGYETFQYVNPGGRTVWNVTILNQGDDNDTVTVQAVANPDTWDVAVRPAASFRIGPGESVTVGILATAPEDAEEEDNVAVNVTATSTLAKGLGSTVTLRAVVTSGIDIADSRFQADNETSSRVALADEKGSPLGAPVALAAVALLGYVVARRRT